MTENTEFLLHNEQLEVIKNRIRSDEVKFIAYEPNMPEKMQELCTQLEEELGLKRITLRNISSLTNSEIESGKDYLSLMYENLSVLESIASSAQESVVQEEVIEEE